MKLFFDFFYEIGMSILMSFWALLSGIFGAIWGFFAEFGTHVSFITYYFPQFDAVGWILGIISLIILAGIIIIVFYLIFKVFAKYIIPRKKIEQEELLKEIRRLNAEVMQLIDEKNRIMAMKVSQLGIKPGEELEEGEEGEEEVKPEEGQSRFVKLIAVDKKHEEEQIVITDPQNYTLFELVDRFRNFACKRMGLYYERHLIMTFISALACSRMIILEGISGTGKTSLPYSWGKFLKHDSAICAVQPSWRDRSELIGYLNEFTKRFNESDFLKAIYDQTYRPDIGIVVLDEMNLARVEYYFAEILSTLEMPDPDEWLVDVVPDTWATDPKNLQEGKVKIYTNTWFVGTANNDDSTFTITDKVYDRAVTIQINTKGTPFECEDSAPMQIDSAYLAALFAQAKAAYPVSEDTLQKLDALDYYVIENFRLAFGNRILKQIKDFVPVFVACGGTEIGGLDYMLTYKIFKKFEGLNVAFMKDNMKKLIAHLEKVFGRGSMPLAKGYIERIMNMG